MIKRIIAIIMVLSILIICQVSSSAYYDKEIMFRNLKWGMNVDEVKNALSDLGSWNDAVGYTLAHWSDESDSVLFGREENGWAGWCYNSNESLKVAGYPVSWIYCFFSYGIDDDGLVLKNREDSELYIAKYVFDVMDSEGTYGDLRNKLSSIYGDGKEKEEEGGGAYNAGNDVWKPYKSITKTTEWVGANNTAIKLIGTWDDREMGTSFDSGVVILYGRTDYDEKLTNVEKAVKQGRLKEERESRTSETDGL